MNKVKLLLAVFVFSFELFACDILAKEPVGVVTICFDDAQQSVYSLAFPKLNHYGLPANLYVISCQISDRPTWYMSWEQIDAVSKAGWEIGSHSCSHKDMTKLDENQVKAELTMSKKRLEEHGYEVNTFGAPFGEINDNVIAEVKKNYNSQRGTERRTGNILDSLNELNVDEYRISAIQFKYEDGFEGAKKVIDQAVKQKKWAVFYLHSITSEHPSTTDYQFDVDELQKLASYLRELETKGYIEVKTISQYLMSREK